MREERFPGFRFVADHGRYEEHAGLANGFACRVLLDAPTGAHVTWIDDPERDPEMMEKATLALDQKLRHSLADADEEANEQLLADGYRRGLRAIGFRSFQRQSLDFLFEDE